MVGFVISPSCSQNYLVQQNTKSLPLFHVKNICQTCSGDDHVWPCAVAQRDNFLPTQDVDPPGLNGALRVPEAQTATAVRPKCKHLRADTQTHEFGY